jgi:hypothetical protein
MYSVVLSNGYFFEKKKNFIKISNLIKIIVTFIFQNENEIFRIYIIEMLYIFINHNLYLIKQKKKIKILVFVGV